MSPISAAAVYFIIWWITLFVVLPFGVRNATEAREEVEAGNEPGAPVRSHIGRKFLVTTAISTVLFLALYWLLTYSGMSLEDIPFLDPRP
jgi:predicted secreted protein